MREKKDIKICAYVNSAYSGRSYKNNSFDKQQFFGLRVIIDVLARAGYSVDFAGAATVHKYDYVLVSITAQHEWWPFIRDRLTWQPGNYKVLIGGAGMLHISPFLRFADFFMFGRGEELILPLIEGIERDGGYDSPYVADARNFDPASGRLYYVKQAERLYPHEIELAGCDKTSKSAIWGAKTKEAAIGCNHSCFFCNYSWARRWLPGDADCYRTSGGRVHSEDKERAILDWAAGLAVDYRYLITTAIDGFSERLRFLVNKKITDEILYKFTLAILSEDGRAMNVKYFNICGLPTETEDDWWALIRIFERADKDAPHYAGPQHGIILHSTPFNAQPVTPLACAPMSKRNYRGEVSRVLGKYQQGNLIFKGDNLWAVESSGTESLSTVMLHALAVRGSIDDSENIIKLCRSSKFWNASAPQKEATLCKYFDMDKLFGCYTADTLPSRYLRTYGKPEVFWPDVPNETGLKYLPAPPVEQRKAG